MVKLGSQLPHPPPPLLPPPPWGSKCTYPVLGAALDQAETLPVKCVLCFLSVASPGVELHRKEEGG